MKITRLFALTAGLIMFVSSFAAGGGLEVGMKSDEDMSLMVVFGQDQGKFDSESDFMVIGKNGEAIAPIYPFEIFEDRFWSEPLSEEVYKKISEGMEVRPVTLDKEPHWEIRYRGTEFILYRKRKQIAELKRLLEILLDRTNSASERLLALGKDIAHDSERSDEMRQANKLRNEIESLIDDRNDLNSKLEDLQPVTERNQKKYDRLRDDISAKDREINEKRQELEKEENRAGLSNTRIFESMRSAGDALEKASTELQTLSSDVYNALSHLDYVEQNIQKPSGKHPGKDAK